MGFNLAKEVTVPTQCFCKCNFSLESQILSLTFTHLYLSPLGVKYKLIVQRNV